MPTPLMLECLDTLLPAITSLINLSLECGVFPDIWKEAIGYPLYPELQSAYHKYHSTETALLKVTNDILLNMNSQRVSLLVLLDLSAAFDMTDHSILLNRLKYNLGIDGTALSWFESYLTNRKLCIHVDGSISEEFTLNYGVPQCSCLGPLLLIIIYASEIFSVIDN